MSGWNAGMLHAGMLHAGMQVSTWIMHHNMKNKFPEMIIIWWDSVQYLNVRLRDMFPNADGVEYTGHYWSKKKWTDLIVAGDSVKIFSFRENKIWNYKLCLLQLL